MTLLTIVKSAALRCGFSTIPASAAGNTNQDIQQLVSFAQDAGRELLERANWVNLDTSGTVTGDGVSTLFLLPQDWVRFSPSDKSPYGALVSNKYPLAPLYGPINTEDLNLLKALPASTVRPVWRIIGGALEIWPALAGGGTSVAFTASTTALSTTLSLVSSFTGLAIGQVLSGSGIAAGTTILSMNIPAATLVMSIAAVATASGVSITATTPGPGELVTFNYYSSFWIMDAARTVSRAAWVADDDFSLINEDTVMKGAVWRWKASKGLEYAEDFRAYEMSFMRNAGQQQTERVISTSRKYATGEETFLGTITDLTSH